MCKDNRSARELAGKTVRDERLQADRDRPAHVHHRGDIDMDGPVWAAEKARKNACTLGDGRFNGLAGDLEGTSQARMDLVAKEMRDQE